MVLFKILKVKLNCYIFSDQLINLYFTFWFCVSCVKTKEEMSANRSNGSQMVHKNDVGNSNNVNDVNINDLVQMGGVEEIQLLLGRGNIVFSFISTMIQFLHRKGLFGSWILRIPISISEILLMCVEQSI